MYDLRAPETPLRTAPGVTSNGQLMANGPLSTIVWVGPLDVSKVQVLRNGGSSNNLLST